MSFIRKYMITILKYLFPFILIILAYNATHEPKYILMGAVELSVIFLLSNLLLNISRHFIILNDIFLLLFNAETAVLCFGNTYVSYVMLENTDSIRALSGGAAKYITAIILVLIFSFLPIKHVEIKRFNINFLLPAALVFELMLAVTLKQFYTPIGGMYELGAQWHSQHEMAKLIEAYADFDEDEIYELTEAYLETKDEITDTDTTAKDKALETEEATEEEATEETGEEESSIEETAAEETEETTTEEENDLVAYMDNSDDTNVIPVSTNASGKNVILILTEGLSKSVITDSRGIMPNLAAFANQSVSFNNYYNHTFATYRAIQGTLYSGHQFENYDKNNLTSVMDIMRKNGYTTAMINTEPQNSEFTSYLNNLGFDRVISNATGDKYVYDKDAYEQLYDTALEYEDSGKPFFLVIYTFGTHASLDSPDNGEKFGDASMPELNKFYNADYQFGIFFEKYKDSALFDDTIIVFTADHATYVDDSYKAAFDGYTDRSSTSCDEIPFYIYDKGVAGNIDAHGRNSLDMVPTLLDYLGLSSSSDFLGQSLYKSGASTMDTYFWDPGSVYYTGDDTVSEADDETAAKVSSAVTKYCAKARR